MATAPTVQSLYQSLEGAQTALNKRTGQSNTLAPLPPPKTPGTGAISYNTLSATPSPLSLQQPTPTIGTQGLEGYIGASLESFNRQQEAEIATLKDNQAQGQSTIASIYERLTGQGERSEQIYRDEGVDEARKQADDYTSQIEAEQVALRRSIDTMRAKGAQSRGSFNDEVARLERESLSKQADLGILQAAATRRYDTASAIADRKIQMEFEPLKVQLEALKFFYGENKAELSDKEDKQFQQLITQDERAYTEKYEAAKTLQDTKLEMIRSASEQNAPEDIKRAIQSATTPEEVIAAAGQYAGDILARQLQAAQLAKLREAPGRDTQIVDVGGRKYLVDSNTGETIREIDGGTVGSPLQTAAAKGNIDLISGLARDNYLRTAVGPNPLARTSVSNFFTGGKNDFVAGVEQLRSQLTLDSLINAKAKGATFGALSEGELGVLTQSATKLGTWAIKDKSGNVTGYKASQTDFKREIDKINNFAKLDYLLKGGNPEEVGVQIMEDGTFWTQNSDGTYTQLQ